MAPARRLRSEPKSRCSSLWCWRNADGEEAKLVWDTKQLPCILKYQLLMQWALSMFTRIEFWIGWHPLDGSDPNQSRDIRVCSGETPKEKLSSSETPNGSFTFWNINFWCNGRFPCLLELNFGQDGIHQMAQIRTKVEMFEFTVKKRRKRS
jgi:hypothetical protein